jgi:hypothetical protein
VTVDAANGELHFDVESEEVASAAGTREHAATMP